MTANHKEIHKNTMDIISEMDAVILDATGVFNLDGNICPKASEVMKEITKKVPTFVLTNYSGRKAQTLAGYVKKGLNIGEHFTDVYTSGEFGYERAESEKIEIKGKKVYVIGEAAALGATGVGKVPQALEGLDITVVDDIKDAEVAYCGLPRIDGKDIEYDPLKTPLENAALFVPELQELKDNNIALVGFNPDLFSVENGKRCLRYGAVTEAYEQMGGKSIVSGKPFAEIYEPILKRLESEFGITDKSRILMVGDTLETDVLGAQNAGIKSCLLLHCGVTFATFKTKEFGNQTSEISKSEMQNKFLKYAKAQKIQADFIAERL